MDSGLNCDFERECTAHRVGAKEKEFSHGTLAEETSVSLIRDLHPCLPLSSGLSSSKWPAYIIPRSLTPHLSHRVDDPQSNVAT